MKQLIQNFQTGEIELIEVPTPTPGSNQVLIESVNSLISVGTEKMLVDFAKSSLLDKARKQPDKVKQVLQKVKTDGLLTTIDAVRAKLSDPIPLGYSNVGTVAEIGKNISEFKRGDRVVSNGSHSEVISIGKNLVAKIPDNVDDITASFTVVGAIGLQGIRLLNPTMGECIAVIGLGLIGQLTVQMLIANGCKVLAIDIDEAKVKMAEKHGAVGKVVSEQASAIDAAHAFSKGKGVDGVLITASTSSNQPIEHAAEMCRARGRIILVGVAGINIPRHLFYDKELIFQVSCSYGAGRYDESYEEQGVDYPIGHVRWTEKRNFEAVLDLMATGKIRVKDLVTHTYEFEKIQDAYNTVTNENPLGVILAYKNKIGINQQKISLNNQAQSGKKEQVTIGYLGVGNFAKMVLLPALKKTDALLHTIASTGGLSGSIAARKFGFNSVTSQYDQVFKDKEINTIFISTRHNSHARLVIDALKLKKNVFVEKPLCLNLAELKEVIAVYKESCAQLMVGFNRRFSPFVKLIKDKLKFRKEPITISIMINAGNIPISHWVHDPAVGGGRIIGEGCHFIDLARFLVGCDITHVYGVTTEGHSDTDDDKMIISLKFSDGSIANINYFSCGSKQYPKERVEVFYEGKVLGIDNFKSAKGFGVSLKKKSLKQDKGHNAEVQAFVSSIKDGNTAIPFDEIVNVHLASFAAVRSAQSSRSVAISDLYSEL